MIVKKEITMYITSDNRKFEHESEAMEHEINYIIHNELPNSNSLTPKEYVCIYKKEIVEILTSEKKITVDGNEISLMWSPYD